MPDVDDPGNPPRKSKEHHLPGQHAKQVHFETTNGGGKQPYPPPPQASSAPNSPGDTQAASPRRSQQQTSSKSAPVDNQPTSFPQVGAPPGQFGPGQWYTSTDPRMSLNQPQQYYHQQQPQYHLPPNGGGYWQQPGVPVFANGAPAGAHFYPTAVPPHYAAFNNICHPQPAYSAVPVGQPGYVIAQQPAMLAQPMTPGQQPVYIAGQAPPGVMQGAPQPFMSCGGGIPVIAAQQVYY